MHLRLAQVGHEPLEMADKFGCVLNQATFDKRTFHENDKNILQWLSRDTV